MRRRWLLAWGVVLEVGEESRSAAAVSAARPGLHLEADCAIVVAAGAGLAIAAVGVAHRAVDVRSLALSGSLRIRDLTRCQRERGKHLIATIVDQVCGPASSRVAAARPRGSRKVGTATV